MTFTAVGFKAPLDHAVIIRGRQCRLAAIRLRHDIDHDWELSASTLLGLDLGYQFDLVPGEVDSRFGDAGDVELQSFFLRVGLRWPL